MDGAYSFLGIGKMYQAAVDATVEACRRFGAEKAESVISEALYCKHQGDTPQQIKLEVFDETGLKISDDDLQFVFAMGDVRDMVDTTIRHLKEACNGR